MSVEVIVGLIGGLVSLTIGVMVYLGARKTDAISEKSGAASDNRAGVAQSFEILNSIVDTLQEDKIGMREEIRYITVRLDGITKEFEVCKKDLARALRKLGENGE